MQRLRASDMGSTEGPPEGQGDSVKTDGVESKGVPDESVSVSHEVTVENRLAEDQEEKKAQEVKDRVVSHSEVEARKTPDEKECRITSSLPETTKPTAQTSSSTQTQGEEQDKGEEKEVAGDDSHEMCQEKSAVEAREKPTITESTKPTDCQGNKVTSEKETSIAGNTDKKTTSSPDTPNRRKMAANLSLDHGLWAGGKISSPTVADKEQAGKVTEEKAEVAGKQQDMSPGSWCQTQLPEAVAERQVGTRTIGEVSPRGRDREGGKTERSSQSSQTGKHTHCPYGAMGSSSLGRNKTVYVQGQRDLGHGASYASSCCSPYSIGDGAMYSSLEQAGGAGSDWQMDSVIEQIEKQMAAVLEKIEGDMPSLLEQISDCPETLPRAKSAQSSPSTRPRSYHHHSTPPPLPTTPRPPMPSLPHLTIPPPSYPPPSPPSPVQAHSQSATDQDEREGQRGAVRLNQSPRGGTSGRGL